MDVSLVLIVIMAVLFGCGVYAMLERSLTRVLIGFLLLGNAVNLLLLIVMGRPGKAPFFGIDGDVSDPLPQALTLTAIVITFAVSAFLLALIYRSWQLGKADTVEDDETDIALRERTEIEEDLMDDEVDQEGEDATTDFVGVATSPIRVLHARDLAGIVDDAPVDRPDPHPARPSVPGSPSSVPERAERDEGRSTRTGADEGSTETEDDDRNLGEEPR
ncbi:MAG: Na(+)/H(+) antiporter subunit C [Actinobacteria bacterium]|nr:Na(+)/H(+) antiporter subunit C [Actinomycetota bacterium]